MNLINRLTFADAAFDNLSPQAKIVAAHLKSEGSISAVEANAVHRIRSVSRRITELIDFGFEIIKEYRKDVNGQLYVRYVLA